MAVERKGDNSITIAGKNGVTVISRITGDSDNKREERFKGWVEECVKLVTPNLHTFKETVQYFLAHCDAMPIPSDDRQMQFFKSSVIINNFKNRLRHQPPNFSFDMSDEEIEMWQEENDAMREEAQNSPSERFGLVLLGYSLPKTERNAVYYEEARQNWERHAQEKSIDIDKLTHQNISFFFEETTDTIQASGGGNDLVQKIVTYRGVSQEDIDNRSPRFLGYISTLRDMGKLPGF